MHNKDLVIMNLAFYSSSSHCSPASPARSSYTTQNDLWSHRATVFPSGAQTALLGWN